MLLRLDQGRLSPPACHAHSLQSALVGAHMQEQTNVFAPSASDSVSARSEDAVAEFAAASASNRSRRRQGETATSGGVSQEFVEQRVNETLHTKQAPIQESNEINKEALAEGVAEIHGIVDRMQAKMAKRQEELYQRMLAQARSECDEKMRVVGERIDESGQNVATLSANVAVQAQQLEKQEELTKSLLDRVKHLEEELVTVRQPEPSYVPGSEDWGRDVDLTIPRARAGKEFKPESLRTALAPLVLRAKLPENAFEIQGPALGKAFVLASSGTPELAARHAGKLHAAQRGANGDWQALHAALPTPLGENQSLKFSTWTSTRTCSR